jgi:hypothetical protein
VACAAQFDGLVGVARSQTLEAPVLQQERAGQNCGIHQWVVTSMEKSPFRDEFVSHW